jgi:hypothetical protein
MHAKRRVWMIAIFDNAGLPPAGLPPAGEPCVVGEKSVNPIDRAAG